MDYVNRLDNFDGPAVGEVAVEAQLYEEAFSIFKKFNLNVQAVNVLLDNIRSVERAVEFAFRVEEDAVWSQVAKLNSERVWSVMQLSLYPCRRHHSVFGGHSSGRGC
ncbi:hypothetical protein MLD38_008679 [Melastoma candidum]|uniref:Uncharacterized protein n=1 Tax=Melastoma candidum TaxID=119954 RepID=A0ACB9RY63_9MYRT|nr:hypothetical protein MLD38_008679 [Melastoma candidum]